MPNLLALDVSDLEPPEPMTAILHELQQLNPDTALKVCHRKRPVPLFSFLQEMGYAYHCVELGVSNLVIYIWPEDDQLLAEFCHQQASQDILP